MADEGSGTIQSASQFKKTPTGLYERWILEIEAAEKNQSDWLKQAEDANRRYLGEKEAGTKDARKSQINLFHANVNIVQAILFGQIPKVDVSRRFADPDDEEARVASEALERHLNTDIEESAEDFVSEIKDTIQDWKITGLGQVRLRYEFESEDVPGKPAVVGEDGTQKAPEVQAYSKKTDESIETEYVYWRDFLWSPARRWKDVRWVAFRIEMTRDQAAKRWGDKVAKALPLQQRKPTDKDVSEGLKEVWSRALIWEIWSKDDEQVYFLCPGYRKVLETVDDPLELEGFFPCPRPLLSNTTTTKLVPKPDLEIDRHIYDEIDELAARLRSLVKAARMTGAYDKAFPELGRILHEAQEGQLVGVDNFGGLNEKGGLAGVMQWVPLKDIADTIGVLTQKLAEKITLLYQVTGISDIVRGQAEAKATATEQSIKAQFASTRLQTDQDEVARFATDLQKLRAEIISKHYDAATIIRCSNLMRTELMEVPQPPSPGIPLPPGMPPPPQPPPKRVPNMALISKAVELIKSDIWQYRIEVKSDSISLRDYAALKSERVETITTMAALFQQAVPMVQIYPKAAPFLLDICDWLIAATKGSQQMQGMFQRFKAEVEEAANQPPGPPPPDPKLQAAQVKAQAEIGKAHIGLQQTQMDAQAHTQQVGMEMQQAREEHAQNMQSMEQKQRTEALKSVAQTLHPQQQGKA